MPLATSSDEGLVSYPPRIVSGIRPTLQAHLGHYFGALQHHIELHHRYPGQSFFVIADYHAMTSPTSPEEIHQGVLEVVATYLALGLDPQKAAVYRQSDVPEATELFWILSCYARLAELDRVPTVRALGDQRGSGSLSQYAYPVLMAADILGTRATIVPVGEDQQSYVELTRELARRINRDCRRPLFPEPRLVLTTAASVPGLDGGKMNHRDRNVIGLFEKYGSLKTKIAAIRTDSKKAGEPKDSATCTVFKLYSLVAPPADVAVMKDAYDKGTIGYDQAKKQLLMSIQDRFAQYEERYSDLKKDPDMLEDVLREGFSEARAVMRETLGELRPHIGIAPS